MCVFHPRLLDAEAGSHSNCDEEAIDVQQLHPVTDTLLSHLSLSAPPPPLSPPNLRILSEKHWHPRPWLQTAGPFLSPHMAWSAPSALLVRPSLTPIPRRRCGVTLQMAAGWAQATANLLPRPHGHAWGPAATSALTIDDGAEPAEHIHATGRQRHSAGQSSSSSLLFLSPTPPLCSPMVSY